MNQLTPLMIEQAKALRAEGYGWLAIGKKLQVSEYVIRCELEPEFHQYRIAQARQARRYPPDRKPEPPVLKKRLRRIRPDDRINKTGHAVFGNRVVPDDVWREREVFLERMLQPRELTAELLGDPGPGRSALDKRQGK